jgi:hypothetical protein
MPTTADRTLPRLGAVLAGAALLLAATAALADDAPRNEDRLGACLTSGSAGAPRDSLVSAIVAVRSLCYVQIERVRAERLAAVDARFPADLAPSQANERERARDAETRRLNDEIARVIAAHTGLTR